LKKLTALAALAAALAAVVGLTASTALAANCTTVNTSKGVFTAAQVGGSVTGELDATGCDIGVYYDGAHPGSVSGADIHGALWYGVFVDGIVGNVSVDITSSSIHDIGDNPFNGVQRGLAIYYYGFQTPGTVTGTVSGNTVSRYQKNGITVNGSQASVSLLGNSVTGLGPVDFIAQNGIQYGFGASGTARGNSVAGNNYTPKDTIACGVLIFQANGVSLSQTQYRDNERNLCNDGRGGGQP
jgi:hypothetical protein